MELVESISLILFPLLGAVLKKTVSFSKYFHLLGQKGNTVLFQLLR